MEYKDRIKNVAIYLRKSRNNEGEEDEATLKKHRNRLITIADKNKWKYELFQEVGSSMNENRPEYQRMFNKLPDGVYDAVLSVNLARVTRDDSEAPKFMNLLRNEDILFITDSGKIYDLENQDDWRALKVTGFFDNWEYENIKAQLRKGKKDSAKMGRWSNGTPNYGYVYNRLTKQIEIDETKAKGVTIAFQLVIDGMGVDNIAIELNTLGFRSNKGNLFHGNSVQRMIRSEIYKGWIVSNKLKGRNITEGKIRPEEQWIVVKDAVPIIIDEETWNLANERLDARKQLSPRGKQRKHGLSNLIKCAICGKAHAVSERKDRKTAKVLQPCNKKDRLGVACGNRGLNYNVMMETIISRIAQEKQQLESDLDNLKDDNSLASVDTKALKILQLEERIKKVKKALKVLQIQLEEELIGIDDFKERRRTRTLELDALQKELAGLKDTSQEDEIQSKESNIGRLDVFLNNWKQLPDTDLNEGLTSFIDKIVWHYPKGSNEEPTMEIHWVK